MEIKQLQYFVTLCKELHFTRAAKTLNISQPSLSQQIRILESNVGKPLFNRIGKKISITDTGEVLLKHSKNILSELNEIENSIVDLNNLTKGKVSIGSLWTIVSYLLPPVILRYNYLFPNITMNVTGLNSKSIREQLIDGDLDVGILMMEEEVEELESVHLYTEQFSLAVPNDHELANEEVVSLEVLKKTQNILLPNSYYTRRILNEYCRSIGFELHAFLEMETKEAIVAIVESGTGVSLLANPYLNFKQSDKIKIIPIDPPLLTRNISISFLKDKHMNPAATAFIDELTRYIDESIEI